MQQLQLPRLFCCGPITWPLLRDTQYYSTVMNEHLSQTTKSTLWRTKYTYKRGTEYSQWVSCSREHFFHVKVSFLGAHVKSHNKQKQAKQTVICANTTTHVLYHVLPHLHRQHLGNFEWNCCALSIRRWLSLFIYVGNTFSSQFY